MSSNNDNNDPSQTTQNSEAEDARGELTAQLEDLLNTLSNKFAGVSSEIFAKMDEMSRRLDNLEAQLAAKAENSAGSK
ncbi:hypothetical protein GGTG_00502 [Gaeumannomyces tritici R3-111a-1]|uniref:Heat shock factor binding protein 1 n=1 Tax=Gaeumannomyces tritici (strain R3-111a-1) TaxID=644352 RepID=J3NGW6_GAET3|nr:hypothetical protein GGTG_00502 [Gaeumannomyces tritici R3-111a-1]EJT80506.1 hypothetical protein GGTG_00502 [Gaeumannomyces tritici R3-111a-1]